MKGITKPYQQHPQPGVPVRISPVKVTHLSRTNLSISSKPCPGCFPLPGRASCPAGATFHTGTEQFHCSPSDTISPSAVPAQLHSQPRQKAKQIFPLPLHREYPEHEDDFSLFGDSAGVTSPKDSAMQTCPRADLNGERHTVTIRTSGRQITPNSEC